MKFKAIILALVVTGITLFFFLGQIVQFSWRMMGALKFWGKQKAKAIENTIVPETEQVLGAEIA